MSEYLPLAKLIEQGLEPGTKLAEHDKGKEWSFLWTGTCVVWADNQTSYDENPLEPYRKWRIVSTPPKKITFEASPFLIQRGEKYAQVLEVPVDAHGMHALNCEEDYIVTVEGKR